MKIEKNKEHKSKKINNLKAKGFNLYEIIGIIVITSIISIAASGIIINNNYRTSSGLSYSELLKDDKVKEFLNVYSKVVAGYYESVDKDGAIDSAINGMVSYIGDEYTTYMDNEDASVLVNSLSGKYEGIGISISTQDVGLIVKVHDNSPASVSGLQVNDRIIKVNDTKISKDNASDVSKLIKESTDKKVKLTVNRDNQELEFNLELKEINTPAVSDDIIDSNSHKIGYMKISTFSKTLTEQVASSLAKMESQNIDSLIIDLRNNGGGYLNIATDVASLFLEKGKVIYSLESKNGTSTKKDETDEKRTYPIMVLINGATASAAEILTGALVDSYGAETLGTTSYGKGKVQQAMNLKDGSLVKYTTYKWLRPNGECIDEAGIDPKYGVELEIIKDEEGKVKEVHDTQYTKAIEIMSNKDINWCSFLHPLLAR